MSFPPKFADPFDDIHDEIYTDSMDGSVGSSEKGVKTRHIIIRPRWILVTILGVCVLVFAVMACILTRHSNPQSTAAVQQPAVSLAPQPSVAPFPLPTTPQPTTPQPTHFPTSIPSAKLTELPTAAPSAPKPSQHPTVTPSQHPTVIPVPPVVGTEGTEFLPLPSSTSSTTPSASPSLRSSEVSSPTIFEVFPEPNTTSAPVIAPTTTFTTLPTAPTTAPTTTTTTFSTPVTFFPGLLTVAENGLNLSQGLTARIIAKSGEKVVYANGSTSNIDFHGYPDMGATYLDTRPWNPGGWIYVSNAEYNITGQGGVGAITFDFVGNVIDYRMVLTGSTHNCAGGRTPWGSWISCEEYEFGNIWEVDPTGQRPAQRITLGMDGGLYESFAYDPRHMQFFVTEDHMRGALQRFTPINPNWTDPWNVLKGQGMIDYLVLVPNEEANGGIYYWSKDRNTSRWNVMNTYPNSEGIDVYENQLFFVSKEYSTMYVLDLDSNTYVNRSTVSGLFDGTPDQIQNIVAANEDMLYFTEEGGDFAGIHARNGRGEVFTILEEIDYQNESNGLAFSPDGKHMYMAFQKNGVLFDITRTDGLPFYAKTLNVRYHRRGGSL